jgi:CheY-like chemotaxis protein
MRGDCERCLQAGMDGYLEKPIQSARMFDLLDRAVVKSQINEQIRA